MHSRVLIEGLQRFQEEYAVTGKGSLSAVLQLTRAARAKTMPLDPNDFKTGKEGQVAGLGGGNLKKILREYGITRVLSKEGGRTSRGVMALMLGYIALLNGINEREPIDYVIAEEYWIGQIKNYFDAMPFTVSVDASRTVASALDDLFSQAKKRQAENPGMQYAGTLLQHLVAAKLSLVLPEGMLDVHGASVADAPTDRSGDFVIDSTVIHCTTMTGPALIDKCSANLRAGYQPVIITLFDRVAAANAHIAEAGLEGRVTVWDVQQFLSANVLEHSFFEASRQRRVLEELVEKYNAIVEEVETDLSLRIKLGE